MLFGNLMMKSMQKRMGGNAMQFGKATPKCMYLLKVEKDLMM